MEPSGHGNSCPRLCPADTVLPQISPKPRGPGWGRHSPWEVFGAVRTVLALPALQAVSVLLAELSGPSPFPLAVFAVPFLAPSKAICTHQQGDGFVIPPAGSSSVQPPPHTETSPSGPGQSWLGVSGAAPTFQAQAPRTRPWRAESAPSLPHHPPRHRGASVFRAAQGSFPKSHCLPASPVSPVPPAVGLDASSARHLRLQPSPHCHRLPLPTRPQLNGEKRAQKYPFWGWGWVFRACP